MNTVGNPMGHHLGAPQNPQNIAATDGGAPQGRTTPWFGVSIVVLIWSVVAFGGGVLVVLYLGLGVVMTNTLEGVFEPASGGGAFNWALLWIALIGQLLGLLLSVLTAFLALAHRKRRRRLALGAAVMAFIATAGFLLTGLIQIPLVGILLEALAL